ncbi:alpha-amylase family glycosyl hydrolase [Flavobacterium sp.]|uniref:alpha-amylase family glycosyl hydrolase n=1 Tax=Flavobacterium sp. TaxID=239 RepID=UPI002FDB6992
MKKIWFLLVTVLIYNSVSSQVSWQGGITPDATASATILFDKTGTDLATYTGTIYAHTGVTLNGTAWQNVKGSWGNNTTQPALTLVSGNIYKLDLTPSIMSYYGVSSGSITKINMVFRNAAGNVQAPASGYTLDVGAFQSTLVTPAEYSNTIINSGQNFTISATNTNGNASYNLLANGVSISTATATSFSYTDTNVTVNKTYDLQITQGITTFSKKFGVIVNAGTTSQAMASNLEDGINYNTSDATKATLVLTAPGKDFVYVAGSFNNYQPDNSYLMKRDPSTNKFWLELTGLTSGTNYTYQYWVVDATPTTNSPAVVKTADPYSTLVLSPFDDPYIPANSYPNMPTYPAGQEREVTVLQTGQTPYAWSSATTNFVKPNKDNLVVYEVLIRDFDANRNFQSLIDKIDYFKNLKINAIELMPVMEFEGDEGWGYNPAYHLALDKFYGTKAKMQEFVDLCHQNGIAVILDVALNHAFGRSPLVRMWMKDPDGDGWGDAASDNPYFNEFAKHSYGVGNDFNHLSAYTNYYTKRVIKQWVQEFKIDGFRWDLTKGFTQACSSGDDTCTNAYQADRVGILKDYANYSWSLDPYHYVIFEHLGIESEEKEWANFHYSGDADGISKGVMMWGEMTYAYSQLIEGYSTGGDISGIGNKSRASFLGKRVMGYPESHDKERLMYSAMTYGNGSGTAPPLNNLNNSLYRMSAVGAISILVPGPKMIWHFADLGMNTSIYACTDGTVNTESDTTTGDCKLATKQQPQWTGNWLGVAQRSAIYNNWAKMIDLKKNNAVFNGDYAISPNTNNIRQRVYIYDASLSGLKNVVILANFSVASQNITADFPYPGTWYNLMDNTSMSVTNQAMTITIEPGGFRIYGNDLALGTEDFNALEAVVLAPNPTSDYFTINANTNRVQIYSVTGQLVKSFNSGQLEDYQYNVTDLSKGIYLVKATDGNNHSKTMKLIKQ